MKVMLYDQIIEIDPDKSAKRFHVFTNDLAVAIHCAQMMFGGEVTITLEHNTCYSLEVKVTKGAGTVRFRLVVRETGQVYQVPSDRVMMQVVTALVTLQQRRLIGGQECQP